MNQVLFRQNSLLKLLYIIIQTIIISVANLHFFLFLTAFNLAFFFLTQPNLILKWLVTILKLLPFYISFLFFSLLFDVSFPQQLLLLARIALILLLSVYLVSTSSISIFVADTAIWQRFRLMADLRFFLIAVVFFIPVLITQFKQIAGRKISAALFVDIFQTSLDSIQRIERKAEQEMATQKRKFDFAANFVLIFQMILLVAMTVFYRKILCVI